MTETSMTAADTAVQLQNDLLLKALRLETLDRPPVWMMRQAGRYLPEYMALRRKYDFFTRVQTPELACEITLQPIDIIGVDAAILFSDILVVPQAMGLEVNMEEGRGPWLPSPVQDASDLKRLNAEEAAEKLSYVYDAIRLTRRALNGRVPLIGFAGAPFTLLCYMVDGGGSKTFSKTMAFCATFPDVAQALLRSITVVTIDYLIAQAHAGADVIQVFDSWSGLLDEHAYSQLSHPWLSMIAEAVAPHAPVILFPKGSNHALPLLSQTQGVSAIGIDWTLDPAQARQLTAGRVALQGNFNPQWLHHSPAQIRQEVTAMIDAFGTHGYIANLGHGITPDVPVDHARAFVNAVKEYSHGGK